MDLFRPHRMPSTDHLDTSAPARGAEGSPLASEALRFIQNDPSFVAARHLYHLLARAEQSPSGVVEFGPGTPAAQAALVAVRAEYMEALGEGCACLTMTGRQFLVFAREACGASDEIDLVEILQRLLLTQEQIMVVEAVRLGKRAGGLHDRLDRISRLLTLARWQYVPDRGFVLDAALASSQASELAPGAFH